MRRLIYFYRDFSLMTFKLNGIDIPCQPCKVNSMSKTKRYLEPSSFKSLSFESSNHNDLKRIQATIFCHNTIYNVWSFPRFK